jgi:protoheme IX farnesyltransferase
MESLAPHTALLFGATVSILGLVYLGLLVNPLSSLIAGLTSVIYLGAYTPLKRITPLCTLIGAIPGAAPPLIGWAAATGTLGHGAWMPYTMLFLWQFPHFMAIAWMYRDDYERAGYRVLPCHKERRPFTAIQAAVPAVLMIPVSLVPSAEMRAGSLYAAVACLLGFGFLYMTLRFARNKSNRAARQLLFASIIYLPVIFICFLLQTTL